MKKPKGCGNPETAKNYFIKLITSLLNLTKWVITDDSVQELVECKKSNEHNILGIKFNILEDNFCFNTVRFPI